MLSRYLLLANSSEGSNDYIFRPISYCSKSKTYRLRKSGMLSYTTAREILLSALSSIGLEKSRFCLHSLRSGGATAKYFGISSPDVQPTIENQKQRRGNNVL
jgi:hypothetical protein